MKVFKFGGASIETVERARYIAELINDYRDEKVLIVISAKGKTTNALEKIVDAFYAHNISEAQQLFAALEADHQLYADQLLGKRSDALSNKLTELCTEVEWVLSEQHDRPYAYYYIYYQDRFY